MQIGHRAVAHVTESDEARKDTAIWLADYLGNEKIRRYGIRPDLWLFADLAEAASKAGKEKDKAEVGKTLLGIYSLDGENFELCVLALDYIRGDLDRMQHKDYQRARRFLLN